MKTDKGVPCSPLIIDSDVLTPRLRLLWLGAIVVLFVLAAYPRLVRLPDRGIHGSDVFWYWACASLWSQGCAHFADTGVEFFRPVAFLLHSCAHTLLGHTDWAIKALHANMDLLSTGLILGATWALSGSRWLGLAVAAGYAVNSRVIHAARIELVHAPSTTFLLLAYVPLLLLLRKKTTPRSRTEMCAAVAAGLCLSLGGSLHEDLYLLAPGVALGIALPCICGAGKRDVRLAARRVLCFSVGVLVIPIAFALWLGPGRLIAMLTSVQHVSDLYSGGPSFQSGAVSDWLAWRLGDLTGSVSLLLRDASWILATVPVAGALVFWRRSGNSRWICLAVLLGALGYVILYSIILPTRPLTKDQARVIFPVVFCCLPAAWAFAYHAAKGVSHWGRVAVVVLAMAGTALEARGSAPYVEWLENPDNVTQLRWLHDTLDKHLDDQNRLLIAPTIAQSCRLGMENAVYLGDRMVYLREAGAVADSFDSVLAAEHIGYIFVTKTNDRRLLTAKSMVKYRLTSDAIEVRLLPVVLGRPFGMNRETYSADKETALILDVIRKREAVVFASSRHGTVYSLPTTEYDGDRHRPPVPGETHGDDAGSDAEELE